MEKTNYILFKQDYGTYKQGYIYKVPEGTEILSWVNEETKFCHCSMIIDLIQANVIEIDTDLFMIYCLSLIIGTKIYT